MEPPVYENGRIILGAMISFIPEEDANKTAASLASEIIGALLEEPDLLAALRNADDELFIRLLEVSLLKYYKSCAAAVLDLANK